MSYEWLKDDDTAAPGADATSKSYKPTVEGKYHVVVKNFASESFVKLRYIIFFFISSGLLFVINISRWVSYKKNKS